MFLDKNKDYVVAEHQDLMIASKCSFVAGLFPRSPEESSKSSKFSSIGSRFKVLIYSTPFLSSIVFHYHTVFVTFLVPTSSFWGFVFMLY